MTSQLISVYICIINVHHKSLFYACTCIKSQYITIINSLYCFYRSILVTIDKLLPWQFKHGFVKSQGKCYTYQTILTIDNTTICVKGRRDMVPKRGVGNPWEDHNYQCGVVWSPPNVYSWVRGPLWSGSYRVLLKHGMQRYPAGPHPRYGAAWIC